MPPKKPLTLSKFSKLTIKSLFNPSVYLQLFLSSLFFHTKTKDAAGKQLLKDKYKTTRIVLDKGNKSSESLTN